MQAIASVTPDRGWAEHVLVRLMRRWTACRQSGDATLPSMVSLGEELGVSPEAAVAAASLFQLTEACLARAIVTECCCSRAFSHDERAVILLVASVDGIGPVRTTASVPHGLPGALVWAARSVTLAFGGLMFFPEIDGTTCPFAHRGS